MPYKPSEFDLRDTMEHLGSKTLPRAWLSPRSRHRGQRIKQARRRRSCIDDRHEIPPVQTSGQPQHCRCSMETKPASTPMKATKTATLPFDIFRTIVAKVSGTPRLPKIAGDNPNAKKDQDDVPVNGLKGLELSSTPHRRESSQ